MMTCCMCREDFNTLQDEVCGSCSDILDSTENLILAFKLGSQLTYIADVDRWDVRMQLDHVPTEGPVPTGYAGSGDTIKQACNVAFSKMRKGEVLK